VRSLLGALSPTRGCVGLPLSLAREPPLNVPQLAAEGSFASAEWIGATQEAQEEEEGDSDPACNEAHYGSPNSLRKH
jgi:hypothetical protein